MFATLHAGIGVKQTHSYARSLLKKRKQKMKKIMIALAVVAMAVVSQAASIKWQVKNASDYKGWNVYV